jgi:carbonic anhydrase
LSTTDELLANNANYAATFASRSPGDQGSPGSLPLKPSKHLAVVACMDARIDVHKILGLQEGDAHVIRNAGGVVTDDVIRSLVVSQRKSGTTEIILIHHTDCGMLTFSDDAVKREIQEDTGIKPGFAFEAFTDLDEDVLQSMARIRQNPFIPHRDARGFVFDVLTGRLREVRPTAGPLPGTRWEVPWGDALPDGGS